MQPCCVVASSRTADRGSVAREGQILVRSLACGICASDIHFMDHPEADADDDSGLSTYDADADIVMGHEYCAEVVDYGPGTERRMARRHPGELAPGAAARRRGAGHRPEPRAARRVRRVLPADRGDHPGGAADLPDELVSRRRRHLGRVVLRQPGRVTPKEVPLVIGCGAIGLVGDRVAQAARRRADRRGRLRRVPPGDRAGDGRRRGRSTPPSSRRTQAWRDVAYGSPEPVQGHHGTARPARAASCSSASASPGCSTRSSRDASASTRIFSAGGPPEGEHLHTMTAKRKGLNIQFGGGPSMHPLERGVRGGVLRAPRRHADGSAASSGSTGCPRRSTTPATPTARPHHRRAVTMGRRAVHPRCRGNPPGPRHPEDDR